MQINSLLLAILGLIYSTNFTHSAAIQAPLRVISLDDITLAERSYVQAFSEQMRPRTRRSGSSDFIVPIKKKLANGIKAKVGLLAQGSSSLLSKFSKGSSGGDHHYDIPHSYDAKAFDIWALKKSVLATLLQAAKAIKGGVLAVKGQLIKGGGQLISAKGRFISNKGDALTNLGKHIAHTAILVPPKHGETSHYDHSGPSAYGDFAPSGLEYGGPPNNEYLPTKYHSAYEDHKIPYGNHAGVIVLKKIPTGHGHTHEEPIPDFKPLKPTHWLLPKLKDFVGSIFKASAGLAASASSTAFKASSAAVAAGSTAAVGSLASSSSGGHEHHETIQESIDYHSPHVNEHEQFEHYDEYPPYPSGSDQKPYASYKNTQATHPPPLYQAQFHQKTNVKIPGTSYGFPILRNPKDADVQTSASNQINTLTTQDILNVIPGQFNANLIKTDEKQPHLFIGMNLPLTNTDFDVNLDTPTPNPNVNFNHNPNPYHNANFNQNPNLNQNSNFNENNANPNFNQNFNQNLNLNPNHELNANNHNHDVNLNLNPRQNANIKQLNSNEPNNNEDNYSTNSFIESLKNHLASLHTASNSNVPTVQNYNNDYKQANIDEATSNSQKQQQKQQTVSSINEQIQNANQQNEVNELLSQQSFIDALNAHLEKQNGQFSQENSQSDMLVQASENQYNLYSPHTLENVEINKPFLPTPVTNIDSPISNVFRSFSEKSLAPSKSNKKKKPDFDIVRSVTYELGPDGPIKI